MKIAEFSNSFIPVYDGVGRVVKAYCETLSAMGQQVFAIAPKDPGFADPLAVPYTVLAYPAMAVSQKLPYKVGFPIMSIRYKRLLMNLSDGPFDICHAHDPGPAGQLAYWYAMKNNVPLVGSFHSKYYDDVYKITRSRMIADFGAKVVANFYNKCDEVWAVSHNSAETLKEYGYKGTVQIMPNGTDLRTLDTSILPKIVTKFSLVNDPILLFVGQMNWKKNIRKILEACAQLRKDGRRFQLVLAGRGPNENDIRATAEKLGIGSCTVMTGHILNPAELDGLYYLATLFLFPSIYDNAPMVLREAANMGTAGVVVKGSSAAEVVIDRENGMLCEDTSNSLYMTIKQVLDDPVLLKKISINAKNSIPKSWKGEIMEQVLERYQYLVARKLEHNSQSKG
ncbi:MAG: glycosyltransferase [Sphaerochaetaceae bacterium]|jgi:glycosyltransferase involved in cell wall biosynthesis